MQNIWLYATERQNATSKIGEVQRRERESRRKKGAGEKDRKNNLNEKIQIKTWKAADADVSNGRGKLFVSVCVFARA